MAMNPTALTTAIVNRLFSLWRNEAPAGDDQNGDYFLTQFARIFSEEVISHIQANARCSGTDSGGDSHNNVGIT